MLVLLTWATWVVGSLLAVFLFACLLLILVVLIQRPQGGGLAGAFGSGAGSGQTAFGARTGDALTVATIGFFFIYLVLAVVLNFGTRPTSGEGRPTAAPAPTGGGGNRAPASGTPNENTPAPAGATPSSESEPVRPATVPEKPNPSEPPK
ncbi:MAG: preprotein translocase subunit SecG [Phycisphaerae bacterium]|nr:preprotein translocase subunit SecG [Phycisphaerae bacterium]